MPKYVIEREIPGAGNLSNEESKVKTMIDPTTGEETA
jgi:hypothetical protein